MTNWLDSKEHARQVHGILMNASHYAESIKQKTFDLTAYHADTEKVETGDYYTRNDKYCDPFLAEMSRAIRSALKRVMAEAIERWGDNRQFPECTLCKEYSVFGGPSHRASGSCRSGGRAHCTCDTCY